MKNIVILGVTGSIGTQSLEVIRNTEGLNLIGASCRTNLEALTQIIKEFNLKFVSVKDEEYKNKLENILIKENILGVEIFSGEDGLVKLSILEDADIILTSVVGLSGLRPTIEAIKKKKDIALANKETLVGGGKIVMELKNKYRVNIYPVDSEHSAIFQSLSGYKNKDIKKIILTASGGPFRNKSKEELENVTIKETLNHPNWNMGQKVTVDSATLMNKGFEAIEAMWLFDVEPQNIIVHIHPESILHSAVMFNDNSVIGQLGVADMKLPIQYALNYPNRYNAISNELDLFKVGSLNFYKPDLDKFKCLSHAFYAMEKGGFYPLILNTADEIAVSLYLNEKIKFLEIEKIISFAFKKYGEFKEDFNIENILKLDKEIRDNLEIEYFKNLNNKTND